MSIDINLDEPPIRENRLHSIVGYDGSVQHIANEGCKGCLKNKDRCFTTGTYCAHLTSITSVLGLPDTLVVDHAPIGCCGVEMIFSGGYSLNEPYETGKYRDNVRMFTTKLDETDTVFGGEEKLKNVIRGAYERHHPKEIYIASSCTSAIIGEDIGAVADQMSKELGIKVCALGSAGMRSKLWSGGFDAFFHSTAKCRIKPVDKKTDTIVYAGFASIAKETIAPVFKKLGLDMVFLTAGSSIEDYERAAGAKVSFGQCDVDASYILSYLEQEFSVKYFHLHQPNGVIGFERFITDIAAYLKKEDIAKEIIEEEKNKYLSKIEKVKPYLQGKRAVVALGSGYAFELARMLEELGMKVARIISYHYDPMTDASKDKEKRSVVADIKELGFDAPLSVNNAQQMENYLIIKRCKPDIVITRAHGAGCWSAYTGVPTLDPGLGINMIGYRGLYLFAEAIKSTLRNTAVFDSLKRRYVSPFSEEFENMKPHSFYKQQMGGENHEKQ